MFIAGWRNNLEIFLRQDKDIAKFLNATAGEDPEKKLTVDNLKF